MIFSGLDRKCKKTKEYRNMPEPRHRSERVPLNANHTQYEAQPVYRPEYNGGTTLWPKYLKTESFSPEELHKIVKP